MTDTKTRRKPGASPNAQPAAEGREIQVRISCSGRRSAEALDLVMEWLVRAEVVTAWREKGEQGLPQVSEAFNALAYRANNELPPRAWLDRALNLARLYPEANGADYLHRIITARPLKS